MSRKRKKPFLIHRDRGHKDCIFRERKTQYRNPVISPLYRLHPAGAVVHGMHVQETGLAIVQDIQLLRRREKTQMPRTQHSGLLTFGKYRFGVFVPGRRVQQIRLGRSLQQSFTIIGGIGFTGSKINQQTG